MSQHIIGSAKVLYNAHTHDPLTDYGLAFSDVTIDVAESDSHVLKIRAWSVQA